jgi:hypothetical protein
MFKRAGFGIHIHKSREFGIRSTGWDGLFSVEGKTGNAKIKGSLTVGGAIIRKVAVATDLGPNDETDSGQIKSRVLKFTKVHKDTAIRILYCDNLRVLGKNAAARWEIKVDGKAPPGGGLYYDKYGSEGNYHRPTTLMGCAIGLAPGTHTIGVWIGKIPGRPKCNAYTGWSNSRWTIEAEEVWI